MYLNAVLYYNGIFIECFIHPWRTNTRRNFARGMGHC